MMKIRLLGGRDGQRIWRTFQGTGLAGIYQDDGRQLLGVVDTDNEFLVFQAASGKLVVYQVASPRDSPDTIRVFASFDAIDGHVPAKLFQAAAIKAGVRKRDEYPEVPLEGGRVIWPLP